MARAEKILPNTELLALARAFRGMEGAPVAAPARPVEEPPLTPAGWDEPIEGTPFATAPEGVYPARPAPVGGANYYRNGNGRKRRFTPDSLASMFINERPGENPRLLTDAQYRWLRSLARDEGSANGETHLVGLWLADHTNPESPTVGTWELGPARNVAGRYGARVMYPLGYTQALPERTRAALAQITTEAQVARANIAQELVERLPQMTEAEAVTAVAELGKVGQPADFEAMATLGAVALALANRTRTAAETVAEIRRLVS